MIKINLPGFLKINLVDGHKRSVKAKRNIIALMLRKGISIGINLLLIPVLLKYLGDTSYGIWITISSVVSWMYFFDIGLGQGLRNRFAESLAKSDFTLARKYVSTSYFLIGIISIILFGLFILLYGHLNWSKIFNAPIEMDHEISLLILILFSFFCLQFIAKLISTILTADQEPAIAGYLNTFASILTLLGILFLSKQNAASMVKVGFIVGFSNLLFPFIASLYYFNRKYKQFAPSLSYFDISLTKDLFGLGMTFFIIQVAAVIIYTTDNLIISHLFSPAEVTPYNIAYKYFGVVFTFFAIMMAPIWSATTDAYARGEYIWIKQAIKKIRKVWYLLVVGILVMLLASGSVYLVWIGKEVAIPFQLSLVMAFYVIINSWNMIYSYFLNGTGKIRIQLYSALFGSIVNIPLSIFLARNLGMGVSGVAMATVFCGLISALWSPYQYHLIINNKAHGIWNK